MYNFKWVITIKTLSNNEIDLFFYKLKREKLSTENQNTLYNLVTNLEGRTKNQKMRFLLYYKLIPDQEQTYNFTTLAKNQNCSVPAIRFSVGRIRNGLINLSDYQKEIFKQLIKGSDY